MNNIQIKINDTIIDIKENQIISRDDVRKRIWLTLDDNTRVYIKTELIEGDVNYREFSKYLIEAEYMASKILKAINLPVQDVTLVKIIYEDGIERLACMCYDITNETDYKIESLVDVLCYLKDIAILTRTFDYIKKIVNKIENLDTEEYLDFIYKMFVADMLIGNYDRSFGNIAILRNEEHVKLCPIYDNTSSMGISQANEEISDEDIYKHIKNTNSAMFYENGQTINYVYFFKNIENIKEIEQDRMLNAIEEIYKNIDMDKISEVIMGTDLVDEHRKQYYINYFRVGYEKILIPTLQRLTSRKK